MKNKKICPKCKSNNIKIINYMDIKCVICSKCGYDESKQYDVFPEEKKSQKVKGRYTPYKVGGFKRVRKQ